MTISDDPRISMLSLRGARPRVSRCLTYEFEDVVAELEGAVIDAPAARSSLTELVPRRLRNRADRALERGRCALTRVTRSRRPRHELFVLVCQGLADLRVLPRLGPWLRNARRSVIYVEELWAADLPRLRAETAWLACFDEVFLACAGSVDPLSEQIGRAVHYLPPSVDTLRFAPPPVPPRRCIDLYAMGRRDPEVHRALARVAAERGWFYLYDTVKDAPVTSPAEHRQRLASLVQRTRFFVVAHAKTDVRFQTRGQEEVGFRYFEGTAGGAALVGSVPRAEVFRTLFPWPDAVVPVDVEATPLGRALDALAEDPERLREITRRNVSGCLRHHDVAHRWRRLLESVGLPPTEAHLARERALAGRALAAARAGTDGAGRLEDTTSPRDASEARRDWR